MITKKLFFFFHKCETEKPIVYHLVKNYDLEVNIFRAKVTPEEEGYLLLDVTGTRENITKAIEYVKTFNVEVDEDKKGVQWTKDLCTSCGGCIPHCPTNALHVENTQTREIAFDKDRCIECLSCIEICPFKACISMF